MGKIMDKIFGTHSNRELKRIKGAIEEINELEPAMKALSDHEMKDKTMEFKKRFADGETLDELLPEAFALVREASMRVLGMRHFDVQMIGGIILHQGRISEMKTGEGKTLVATLPVYLNALSGKGVHVVTVNDYLARRDSEWMGKIYQFLGLTVGLIVHGKDNEERREAYDCDITYGTNNEYGFDYLRDNMVTYKEEMVQRDLNFAIVDEVDSILIDEARTPLIISGHGDKSTDLYKRTDLLVKRMKKMVIRESDDKKHEETGDAEYVVDEKAKTSTLTDLGVKRAEQYFGVKDLSEPENMTYQHHLNQAIRAHGIMKNEVDYVVKEGEVIIVDEFTGRMMFGRRYSEGLHQAIEAKEGVKVERESKTLATITFQNYFRMYKKLSGMTGTALTEEMEFREIYKLDVIVIPTNRETVRVDRADVVYKTEKAKFLAVVEEVAECYEKGQPVLIGTISIEKSEELSELLKRRGVKHNVLNAKFHEKEAEIVSQAGKYKAVTIATNMAGRGTDIVLGGNAEFMAKEAMRNEDWDDELISESNSHNETDDEEILKARERFEELTKQNKEMLLEDREKVVDAGGLYIIGTERHESRRIDNQLRGRSGRQGDPGMSRFYLSLEDDLMRLFGAERVTNIVNMLKLPDDQPIEANILSGAIEGAQKKVEARNFGIRKHVIQYDDVMNKQRDVIYKQRRKVLDGESLRPIYEKMIEGLCEKIVLNNTGEHDYPDEWDWPNLNQTMDSLLLKKDSLQYSDDEYDKLNKKFLQDDLMQLCMEKYDEKEALIPTETLRELERVILLRVVDEKWMDHIDEMDQLKNGIGLRAYGQRDPVIEYKFEGFEMFEAMINSISDDAVNYLLKLKVDIDEEEIKREKVVEITSEGFADEEGEVERPVKPAATSTKVGRNDPCTCGSGKKHKNCCGKEA
ncbi:MAG: preprotein translocase subunit SecA [Bacillota bacterium]